MNAVVCLMLFLEAQAKQRTKENNNKKGFIGKVRVVEHTCNPGAWEAETGGSGARG